MPAISCLWPGSRGSIRPPDRSLPAGSKQRPDRPFVNLRTIVEAAGASLERVVRTTVFLGSAEDFPAMNQLFAEFFPSAPPVRSTPLVGLPRGLRISIDATAFLG